MFRGVFYIYPRCVIVAVRACIRLCNLSQRYSFRVYTCSRDEQSDGLRCVPSCTHVCMHVRVCVRARATIGRSVRRWRRAFPFRIAKVQRAIPRCAYFYIHTPVKLAPARSTNNSSEKKQRNTRGMHTEKRFYRVLSSASSSFLCSGPLPRELICRVAKIRSDRTFERPFGAIFLLLDE